ncbi:protein mono-ADP-ribosyltransferase TIPARP-like [Sceloporus undulatus]|uniref:protein mono-ADP-ribosyltransferase TIPARP-like n=1 Tax=Sceloporus undulatus TaxID=8520 RepID=UPI001C4DC300|nr:protein mono-ADP-ribosyltransferase TIPARP-like [Sceloporus undulatus]
MAEQARYSETKLAQKSFQDELLGITIIESLQSDDAPLYHVHQKDGVLICDDFLLGCCPLQGQCPCHHTPFPYHWQWRRRKDCVWLSFSFSAQHHLERLYCDKNVTEAKLLDRNGDYCSLIFNGMVLGENVLYDKIRRLSNSSNPVYNPYFHVEWKVYWKECDKWMKYQEPIVRELVAAFEKGMWNHAFYLHGHLYNVDIKQMTQCNVRSGFTRNIMYRPILRTCTSMVPYLRSISSLLHPIANPGDDPLDFYCGPYPATWPPPPQENCAFTMVEVSASEMATHKVKKLFHATLPEKQVLVLAVYRIHNDQLWQAYMRQKEFMSQTRIVDNVDVLERHLFHGTGAAQIKPICTENFNPHLSGLNGSVYGKGIYFAKDANISHSYAKTAKDNMRHMFLAKVLTGYWMKGNSKCRKPRIWYDSCVDCVSDPKIFVVFKNCQCYPYFLIRYKEVNTPVLVDV